MRVVCLFSGKGGAGKSTIAVHLAVAAAQAGERVALLDLDPQRSAESWANARPVDAVTVDVVGLADVDLDAALEGARGDGYTLTVIDSPPHAAHVARRIVDAADLALIPVRPSPFDLAALPATLAIVGDKPAAFVLSACPARAPEVREARAMLKSYGLPVLAKLDERRAYFRALVSGCAVTEHEPTGAAAAEIRGLWRAVSKELRGKKKHGNR